MKIHVKIKRFNPEKDQEPYYKTYTTDADPMDRFLDVLINIKRSEDGSLSFRKSCAHGVCGSDAMRINGEDRLACKTLIKEVAQSDGDIITVEPLRHFPVQKDLIVDQTLFFERYKSVSPFLINDQSVKGKERLQSTEQRKKIDDSTNCILCAACFSACPIFEKNMNFLGPAIIVQANRFNRDSRDNGFEVRLPVLDDPNGVWPCENHFECTRCCPRDIKITKLINETKRVIKVYRQGDKDSSPIIHQ